MTFTIIDDKNECNKQFISFILKQLKYQIYSQCDKEHMMGWDKYFSENQLIPHNTNSNISTAKILKQAADTIVCDKIDNKYVFHINYNTNINGYNAKLYDIIKLINFGNTEMTPYPIITNTFLKLEKDFGQYVKTYKLFFRKAEKDKS